LETFTLARRPGGSTRSLRRRLVTAIAVEIRFGDEETPACAPSIHGPGKAFRKSGSMARRRRIARGERADGRSRGDLRRDGPFRPPRDATGVRTRPSASPLRTRRQKARGARERARARAPGRVADGPRRARDRLLRRPRRAEHGRPLLPARPAPSPMSACARGRTTSTSPPRCPRSRRSRSATPRRAGGAHAHARRRVSMSSRPTVAAHVARRLPRATSRSRSRTPFPDPRLREDSPRGGRFRAVRRDGALARLPLGRSNGRSTSAAGDGPR
jgi:hypothetical protein